MPRDLPSKPRKTKRLPSRRENAGAWVEVYQDGVGWLPLALTPGLESLAPEQTESGIKPVGTGEGEGSGPRVTEGQEPEQDDAEQSEDPDNTPDGGQRKRPSPKPPCSGFCSWLEFCSCLFCLSSSDTISSSKTGRKLFDDPRTIPRPFPACFPTRRSCCPPSASTAAAARCLRFMTRFRDSSVRKPQTPSALWSS